MVASLGLLVASNELPLGHRWLGWSGGVVARRVVPFTIPTPYLYKPQAPVLEALQTLARSQSCYLYKPCTRPSQPLPKQVRSREGGGGYTNT
jgi:hypothetical protein